MYTPILATLIYVLSEDKKSVLMIHRNKRKDDAHYGKYNGLGGKVERDEDLSSSMKRELLEEAGIVALEYRLKGTVNWPGFGKAGEDWFGFVFVVDKFEGNVLVDNHEGSLEWVLIEQVSGLNLWEGDLVFLDRVFDDQGFFNACIVYDAGTVISYKMS
jgi:8-oxo-dGTP diphosphatase